MKKIFLIILSLIFTSTILIAQSKGDVMTYQGKNTAAAYKPLNVKAGYGVIVTRSGDSVIVRVDTAKIGGTTGWDKIKAGYAIILTKVGDSTVVTVDTSKVHDGSGSGDKIKAGFAIVLTKAGDSTTVAVDTSKAVGVSISNKKLMRGVGVDSLAPTVYDYDVVIIRTELADSTAALTTRMNNIAIEAAGVIKDTASFTGSATSDTVIISGIKSNYIPTVTPKAPTRGTLPVAGDLLNCWISTDTLFANRAAGTTADLKYFYSIVIDTTIINGGESGSTIVDLDSLAHTQFIFIGDYITGKSTGDDVLVLPDSSGYHHDMDSTSKVQIGSYNSKTGKYLSDAVNGHAAVDLAAADSAGYKNNALGDTLNGAHKSYTVIAVVEWHDTTTAYANKSLFSIAGLNSSTGFMNGGLLINPAPTKALWSYFYGEGPYEHHLNGTDVASLNGYRLYMYSYNGYDTVAYAQNGGTIERVYAGGSSTSFVLSTFVIGKQWLNAGDGTALQPARASIAAMYIANDFLPTNHPGSITYFVNWAKTYYAIP